MRDWSALYFCHLDVLGLKKARLSHLRDSQVTKSDFDLWFVASLHDYSVLDLFCRLRFYFSALIFVVMNASGGCFCLQTRFELIDFSNHILPFWHALFTDFICTTIFSFFGSVRSSDFVFVVWFLALGFAFCRFVFCKFSAAASTFASSAFFGWCFHIKINTLK